MRWRKDERQNEHNGRMVEEEVRCNIKEEGRRLESDKNGKMGHREGETDVVERRIEEKERQKGYKSNSRITFNLRIQFVPREQTQSAGYNGFQPPLTCSHEYHYSHHKKYTTSIFICTLFVF